MKYFILIILFLSAFNTLEFAQDTTKQVLPYYNADPTFTMDHMFLPNHYSKYNSHFNREITLSYLITHLDGMSVNDSVRN